MQLESRPQFEVGQKMKAQFPKQFRVDEQSLPYQNLIKKGHYIKPKLEVEMIGIHAASLNKKVAMKLQLVKIFKKTRLIRKLDFSTNLESREFFLSTFLYIAKKVPKISALSVYDSRNCVSQYKGLVTSWPKYMKHLRSLRHEPLVESSTWAQMIRRNRHPVEPPETILSMTGFLGYTRKLENVEVIFPHQLYFSRCLNPLWRFEKFPKSPKKLAFCEAQHSQNLQNFSLAGLKNLKDLEVTPKDGGSLELMKSVSDLISQVNQLETLNIRFVEKFEIDASICAV